MLFQKLPRDIISILELKNFDSVSNPFNQFVTFFEMLSGKKSSQSRPVIHISCNKTYPCTTYGERNPSGSKSVAIFFRKLRLVYSSSLQQGSLASLNVNISSLAFHNIPKDLMEGKSSHFKLTSIVLSSSGISFKTSDSFDTQFRAWIPAFPHNSDNSLYSFIASSLILFLQPVDTHSCSF